MHEARERGCWGITINCDVHQNEQASKTNLNHVPIQLGIANQPSLKRACFGGGGGRERRGRGGGPRRVAVIRVRKVVAAKETGKVLGRWEAHEALD